MDDGEVLVVEPQPSQVEDTVSNGLTPLEISASPIEDVNKDNNITIEEGGDGKETRMDKWCGWWRFDGVKIAQAYNVLGAGRGCLVMSNIFLATSLTYLASEHVGCLEESDDNSGKMVVVEDCDEKVFGLFRPASLITNIAVIWGVLAALFMPVTGAVIDYTPHRWKVGVGSALFMMIIQAVQIGTTSSTWFYMALLQALSGFLYQVQNLTSYAYLPNIARTVGEETMTKYAPTFTMVQFSAQAIFLLIIIAISLGFGFNDVETARLSQGFNTVTVSILFYFGWNRMPQVPAKHILPEGKRMLAQGFIQNWNTAKEVNQRYKKGLRWFLLSVVFGEAAANAFTIVSVVFLDEQLGLAGTEVGIFFFLALIGMIPGGLLAEFITSRTNPKISWCLSMIVLFVVSTVGALVLNKDNAFPFSYVWGFAIGIMLGWYYPTEGMILSLCVPQGKEAELAGFFVYCTQILGWLPPLVFSLLVEADVDKGVGVMVISSFFLVAICCMSMTGTWNEIIEEVANTGTELDIGGDDKGSGLVANSTTEADHTERSTRGR